MSEVVPTALVLGHQGFDSRASCNFNLLGTASVHLHGVGGRTVQTPQANDLHVVRDIAPDIVILEIRTNDLSKLPPEKVGSAIEDLVRLFQSDFSVREITICYVIPRGIFFLHAMLFWHNATVLNQYVSVVLADLPNISCWRHPEFNNPHRDFYLEDRVHLNPSGQYLLYHSYQGTVLKAVGLLQKN